MRGHRRVLDDLESPARGAGRPYIGRLAPSPTGAMHLGIAQTSLAAWLDARAHEGLLRLRIEDVDEGRVVPGSADGLRRDLEWLGLEWDGPVMVQSERYERYEAAIESLRARGRVYPCTCSRREIRAASAPHPGEDLRYPGTCRGGAAERPGRLPSLRFLVDGPPVRHDDRRLGAITQDVGASVGDFVLRRADGLWAYQLAVTVDDLEQGITCVVRGEDLFPSTPRQLLLRRALAPDALALETFHTPLVLDAEGRRLAKRDGAASVAEARAEGASAETLIGRLAQGLGLGDGAPVTAAELVPAWRRLLANESPEGLH